MFLGDYGTLKIYMWFCYNPFFFADTTFCQFWNPIPKYDIMQSNNLAKRVATVINKIKCTCCFVLSNLQNEVLESGI